MTLHADSTCESCYKNFDMPENWLQDIYNRQKEFQEFMAEKRHTIAPPAGDITPFHIDTALYHSVCANLEIAELVASLQNRPQIETEFEFIDVLFFMLNVGIFVKATKLISKKPLTDHSTMAKLLSKDCDNYQQNVYCALFVVQNNMSAFLDSLPFKKWKTYKKEDYVLQEGAYKDFNLLINDWLYLGKMILQLDDARIYNLYRSKLEENYARQLDSSKGYN